MTATPPGGYEIPRPTSTVHVRVVPGAGPPVVVVPGVMADAESWEPVVAGGGREAHVLDRRGRTPSGPLGPGHGVPTEIADVHAVLDAVGGPVHLFGWSYGALVALEAAVDRDDLLSVTAYEPVSRPFVPEAIGPIRDALAAGSPDRAVELVNTDVSGFGPADVEVLRGSPAWPRLCELALPLADELDAIDRFEPRYDAYAGITAPVTLFVGERNLGDVEPYGPAVGRFRRALPGAELTVLPGVGHLAHVDDPESLGRHLSAAVNRA